MGKLKLNNSEFDIPAIAQGKVIPPKIEQMITEEDLQREEKEAERNRELRKEVLEEKRRREEKEDSRNWDIEKERRQFRHDWKITIFSTFVGAFLSRPLWDGIDWLIALFS